MNADVLLAEIDKRMRKHPGDAPWSCVACYHDRPCVDREILLAAKRDLTKQEKQ